MHQYNVHGIGMAVTSNWPRLLEMVSLNYKAFSRSREAKESLEVEVALKKKSWFPQQRSAVRPQGGEEKWGTDIFVEGPAVRFRSEREGVEFIDGSPSTVRAWYVVDRRSRIASLYREVPAWEACQRLMRLALHTPLFHLLERQNMQMFHAAAVASKGEALLFIGLNGSGKSSLCFSLLDELDYMSDNFVLWNGTEVLGFPEAIRLPVAELGAVSYRTPVVYGKRLIPVDEEKITLRARPIALVIVTQASQTRMAPLPRGTAESRISAIHDMTHEFPQYGYLGPLSQPANRSRLQSLARSVPTYHLAVSDTKLARELLLDLF